MKKILALLLALAMGATLFGCAGENNETSQSDPTTSSQTTTTTGSTSESDTTEPDTSEPVTYKSYTGTDEAAAAARLENVATVGDVPLTNGQLQLYYWMGIYTFMSGEYGSYASLLGLDYASPLDQQGPTGSEESWQEFFLEDALSTWHLYQALAITAESEGMEMPEALVSDLENLYTLLEESAEEGGFDSVDQMIQADAGAGCTAEDYYVYTQAYYYYLTYIMHMSDTIEVTQADIDAYFAENEEALAEEGVTKDSGNVYGVRHILIEPEGGTEDSSGNTTYSDEEWEACRVKAQTIMDTWAAGEATEATFAALANTHSADPGSNTNGGLYDGLDKDTSFVEPFKEWYLDESRQVGDYGLVKTDYGYHIMYMSSSELEWISYCRDSIITDAITAGMTAAQESYPLEVEYDKIILAEVTLMEES